MRHHSARKTLILFVLLSSLSLLTFGATAAPVAHAASRVQSPQDPYVPCGNWAFSPGNYIWQWCDAGFGPHYLQGQIGTLHFDTTFGWHYNLVIQYADIASPYFRNYHIVYTGTGAGNYVWGYKDSVTGQIVYLPVSTSYSPRQAAQFAASNMAHAVAGSIGDQNIYSALLTYDLYGDPGTLTSAFYDLMSYPYGHIP